MFSLSSSIFSASANFLKFQGINHHKAHFKEDASIEVPECAFITSSELQKNVTLIEKKSSKIPVMLSTL